MRLEAANLLVELLDALAKLRLLAGARAAAQLEQLALAVDDRGDIGILGARARRSAGNLTVLGAVALAFEARLAGGKLVEALGDDGQVGARDGVVETHHDVALLDAVAVAHAQFADDAAGRMLNLLDVGIDDDRALGDQCAGQRHGAGPAADAAGQHDDDHQPGQRVATDGSAGVPFGLASGHELRRSRFGTTLSERAAVAVSRCSTRASTSSLGPNAWARPWFIISSMIDAGDRARPMGDDDDDAAAVAHAHDGLAERFVALGVEIGVRLVQHDQERIAVERARERDALRLPGRERGAAFADLGLVALGQADDQIMDAGRRGCRDDRLGDRADSAKRPMFCATVPANSSTSCGR